MIAAARRKSRELPVNSEIPVSASAADRALFGARARTEPAMRFRSIRATIADGNI